MRSSPHRRLLLDCGEFRAIDAIRRRFGQVRQAVFKGIGDDAAVLPSCPHSHLLISTDLLIQGIHFDLRFESFRDVGYRAAVANLSDIAAMGGLPQYLLVALAIPGTYAESDFFDLYDGIMAPCQEYGVKLIGGDTSASQQNLFLAITIIGKVESDRALGRDGAQLGDLIYVTGTLGNSNAGLHILQTKGKKIKQGLTSQTIRFLTNRHLYPTPRIKVGRLLSTNRLATAAIDLSDGLSGDLRHLCQESKVGAEIDETKLPLSQPYRAYTTIKGLDPIKLALQGGEDYELLFTVSSRNQPRLERHMKKIGDQATHIGIIKPQRSGIRLKLKDGSYREIPKSGYEHFRT